MRTQEKMFVEVETWLASGEKKARFLQGKAFSVAKFKYWVAKWKTHEQMSDEVTDDFRELNYFDVKRGKVMEIEALSGVKITVFA
jgi:hypothetical protein